MAYLGWGERRAARWGTALWLTLGLILTLLLALVLAAWIALQRDPAAVQGFLAAQGGLRGCGRSLDRCFSDD